MGSAMVIPPGDFVVGASVSAWATIWCGSLRHGLHRGAHPSPLAPTLVRDGSSMGLAAMTGMARQQSSPAVARWRAPSGQARRGRVVQEPVDLWIRRIVLVAAPCLGELFQTLIGRVKEEEHRHAVGNHAEEDE